MAGVWSTHAVELLPDRVVKRYRQWGEQEHEREWRALTLLQTYAPGLSAVPLDLDTTSPTPTLVMSRVPGTVLRGGIVQPAQVNDDRNPPDTPVRQARRLRALLDARSPTGHEGSSGVRQRNVAVGCREPARGSVPE